MFEQRRSGSWSFSWAGIVFVVVFVLAVAVLALSAGVLAQKVQYNSLAGTNFSQYKTYKWVEIPNGKYPNQLLDEQIKQSIDAQLATKGLRRSEEGNTDLYVVYQAAVSQEQQWNAYSTGGDYWGWGGWGGWGGMSTTTATSSTSCNRKSASVPILPARSTSLPGTRRTAACPGRPAFPGIRSI